MKKRISILVFGIGLGFSFSLSAKVRIMGPSAVPCKDEKVSPNFFVPATAGFTGTVSDQSGALIPGVTLEIRSANGKKVLQSVVVDDHGKFEFARVITGQYRLVPIQMKDGKAIRFPGFDPPESLHCQASARCDLRVVLPVRPNDLPYTFCPPR